MIDIKVKIKNISKFYKQLRDYDDKVYKAGIIALKIEGFRLRRKLQQQLLSGAPGGKQFSPMRHISQLSRQYQAIYGSRLWDKTSIPKPGMTDPALRALAIPIRYNTQQLAEKFKIQVGVLKDKRTSASWRKIMHRQQTGFTVPLTPLVRKAFATWPKKFAQPGHKGEGIYFSESKTHLVVPPRDIIGAFWLQQQTVAYSNIKANFEAKMRGEYVI
jgi:hypothetical protein